MLKEDSLKTNLKSIVFIANSSWYIFNFRKELLFNLKNKGYKIYIICPRDKYSLNLIDFGFKLINWDLNRSSLNVFSEIKSIFELIFKLRSLNVSLIHNFTMKGIIYGTIASIFVDKHSVINSITGLGHLFISENILIKFIRLFLFKFIKYIFRITKSKLIFQNYDDQKLFINLGITTKKMSLIIQSSGVNTNYFKPAFCIKNKDPIVLFPSRVIREKGINELIRACNSLWLKNINFKLYIAGDIDPGNRSSLSKDDLNEQKNNNNINFLGHVTNIKHYYQKADIVILPSWREGLSRALIEAASMEKAIITTDVPGCRDVITHKKNGLLIARKDPEAIEKSILFLIKNNKLAKHFGKEARKTVIELFEVNKINMQTINLYKNLILNK